MQRKHKGKWRRTDKRHQPQTEIHKGVMPTPSNPATYFLDAVLYADNAPKA